MRKLLMLFALSLCSAGAFSAVDVSAGVNISEKRDFNISFFYESLAPHGDWISTADYGWVWEPRETVTVRDWRPYVNDGHWVWTDDGWYWASNYEWGWAPFHYGRWTLMDDDRWGWVPDTTWGPSWVAWREGDSYYGWAALPPDAVIEPGIGISIRGKHVAFNFDLGPRYFSFVPADRFLADNVATVAITRPAEINRYYRESKVINNSYVYNDNRVINNGVPVRSVARKTKQEIKPVQIAEANADPNKPLPREHVSGNKIVAFKPRIKNEAPVAPKTAANKPVNASAAQKNTPANAPRSDAKSEERKAVNTSVEPDKAPAATTPHHGSKADEHKATPPAERRHEPAATAPGSDVKMEEHLPRSTSLDRRTEPSHANVPPETRKAEAVPEHGPPAAPAHAEHQDAKGHSEVRVEKQSAPAKSDDTKKEHDDQQK